MSITMSIIDDNIAEIQQSITSITNAVNATPELNLSNYYTAELNTLRIQLTIWQAVKILAHRTP